MLTAPAANTVVMTKIDRIVNVVVRGREDFGFGLAEDISKVYQKSKLLVVDFPHQVIHL